MKTKFAFTFVFCLVLTACASNTEATIGHENFKSFLSHTLGKPISYRLAGAGRTPLSITKLQNGNDEYRYELNGPNVRRPSCIRIFEVNPETKIILRATYEGNEKGCVIVT